ncbi:universal stress protein [Streptomyces indiaensis]|uniref:Universal stress protein n=1 Tax=Streptomyces indiaensis TaxID=284033 RepID=A0ABN3E1C7_9ACTN|nr:universal stress protein [Streptomyces indiaensis]MCF1645582.1 universal stress protein [Streptomyces indiaensis]
MELPLVVGVDGSDGCLSAIDWAVDEAARHRLPLRLVHGSLWERYEGRTPSVGLDRPAGQVSADHIVASAAERALRRGPDVKVSTDVLLTDATDALLRAGDNATALITGSRGRGELKGLLLGSVGLTVAARAHCPVVVVRGDKAGLAGTHQRILLGVGGPSTSAEAVRFAFREAEVRGGVLDAVRTWRRAAHATPDESEREHEERAHAELEELLGAATAEHPAVRVHRTALEGPARKVLVHRSAAADLVVVGARRRQGRFGLQLGMVAHTLLHHAACPVAVVPQGVSREPLA